MGKQKKRTDATGNALLGKWQFTLKNATLEIKKVKLRTSDYDTDGRWYLAKKRR